MSHFTVIVFGDDVENQLAPYNEDIKVELYFQKCDNWELEHFHDLYKEPLNPEPTLEYIAKQLGSNYEIRDGMLGCLSTYNPLSKWDWYEVGGRWAGFFPLKPGCEGEVSELTSFNKSSFADSAMLKDIDFERAKKEAKDEASYNFAHWQTITNKHGKPESFDAICDTGITTEKARKLYWAQPAIIAMHCIHCPVKEYGFDKEVYIKQVIDSILIPFAYVLNGEWFERGQMGWWVCVSNEKDKTQWAGSFHELLNTLDPETLLTLVDCHI
jgi:hypothetical protein